MLKRFTRQSLFLLIVSTLILVPFAGIAWADYGVAKNCTVVPQVHYVFDGVDKTPPGGTLPGGNPVGFICAGNTYVPLRWFAGTLGKVVGWDGNTYAITVSSSGATQDGVTFNVSQVRTGASGTTVAVQVTNTTGATRYAGFTLNFVDGFGRVLGTIEGPQNSPGPFGKVPLGAGETQTLTATSPSNFSGYISIVILPYGGACPIACPPLP